MPLRSGRRQPIEEEDEIATFTPTQRRQRQNGSIERDEDVDMDSMERGQGSGSLEQLSKGLVRYALSCEHSRKPIKRQDVNEKVLGTHSRLFKDVFLRANSELMDVFGMQLVELPKPERVTVRQKRAAVATDSQNKSSGMWILQSVLPEQYRIPAIIGPSRPLDEDIINTEDSYIGLYTMTIALITISGGKMTEGKLDRALRRMNADQTTPLGTKERTLAAMVKDGYIVKVKEDRAGDDETVDYIVGPRGKVEVGREGVGQLIRMMYGETEDMEELEKRIQRTLDLADAFNGVVPAPETTAEAASQVAGRKRGRPRVAEEE